MAVTHPAAFGGCPPVQGTGVESQNTARVRNGSPKSQPNVRSQSTQTVRRADGMVGVIP